MPTNIHSAYRKLLETSKKLAVLGSAGAIVNWDMETMMPPKAVNLRSEQLALLSEVHHKMGTSPQIGKQLDAVLKSPQYDTLAQIEKRNIYLIKKSYDEQTKLPTKLVAALAKQQAITVNTWKKAKAAQNYAAFKPELEELFDLNMQAAQILQKVKQTKTAYDAFLDIYEPKMTAQTITPIFNELEAGLKGLLKKVEDTKVKPDCTALKQPVSVGSSGKLPSCGAHAGLRCFFAFGGGKN
jgi:carboxypeptidase Taq